MRGQILVLAILLSAYPPTRLSAQCPDGSPPPCAGARRAAVPTTSPIDSTTALVVPLQPLGSDPGLRALGADLAAVIAENITVGDVRGVVAADLAGMTVAARAQGARRKRAGAYIEGTLIRLGGRVRATVRLVAASDGRELTTTTMESSPDSLLAIADRLSVPLLRRWFEAQAGPHTRAGASTDSLRALRQYVQGLVAWRRSDRRWRDMLDSAVQRDPGFLAPLLWLAVPTTDELMGSATGLAAGMASARITIMSPDSARTRGRALLNNASAAVARAVANMPSLTALAQLGAGGASSPLSPMAAFAGCRSTRLLSRVVEPAYLLALSARNASHAGCPESTATAMAAAVYAMDSAFVPAAELYYQLLIDRGDTARARNVLARFQAPERAGTESELSSRWAAQLPDTSGLILALGSWRRFDVLDSQLVRFTGAMGRMGMSPMMLQGLVGVLHIPLLFATGRQDSVARLIATAASPGAGGRAPIGRWRASGSSALPPEPAFFPEPLPGATLDSLLRDTAVSRMEGVPPNDPRLAMMRRIMRAWVAPTVWVHGILAVQRNDLETARRLATGLDSVAGNQLPIQALAQGLRAEVSLASGDTAQALQHIGLALEASALGTAVRYVWLGARLSAAQGRHEVALALARSITMPSRLQGPASAYYYPKALRLEGEMLEGMGRRAEAAAAYRKFVELRRNADASLQPEVEDVRVRLARLESR